MILAQSLPPFPSSVTAVSALKTRLPPLTAPRPLMCQNGLQERPTWFTVPLAREALAGIKPIYGVLGAPEHLEFVAHEGGHVIEVPALLTFLGKHLGREE